MDKVRLDGWVKQSEDPRDLDINCENILEFLLPSYLIDKFIRQGVPNGRDLRSTMPPIQNQWNLGSCTANACACLFDAHLIAHGVLTVRPSRLFIYYYARILGGQDLKADDGASIRNGMKSMAQYGVPPEITWGYIPSMHTVEPPAIVRAIAEKHQMLRYVALVEPDDICQPDLLNQIRIQLHAGRPIVFGTYVYKGIETVSLGNPNIPFPVAGEAPIGAHAMVIVGYDNSRKITNPKDGKSTYGAFLVRNSWGSLWGELGYCWMPYKYLVSKDNKQMFDLWVLLEIED